MSAIFLFLFIREIDLAHLTAHADLIGWRFLVIIGISFLAYLFATIGWLYCFKSFPGLKLVWSFFLARLVGEIMAMMNPTGIVGGDILKVRLLKKNTKVDSHSVVPSVVVSRGLLWVSFLIASLLAMLLAVIQPGFDQWGFTVLLFIVVVAAIYILTSLLFRDKTSWRILNSNKGPLRFLSEKVLPRIQECAVQMTGIWRDKKPYVYTALFFFTLHYVFGAIEFWYILSVLGIEISLSSALIIEMGTSLVRSVVVIVPGQIGIEEYSTKFFLELMNVSDGKAWITVSLIRRIRQLFWILTAVIVYFTYFRSGNSGSLMEEHIESNGSIIR